jgi:hypothetical protein
MFWTKNTVTTFRAEDSVSSETKVVGNSSAQFHVTEAAQ